MYRKSILVICIVPIILLLILIFAQCIYRYFDNHDQGHSSVIRQTLNGPVEGIEQISSLGQKYYSFRGIPYAEPPITGIDPYSGEYVDRRFKVINWV